MLHAIAKLAQDILGHIGGVLRHEINTHPLGPDQARHLFDLIDQGLGRIIKQKMRLVEEKHQLGLVRITHLGKGLEQLGQKPQEEGRI
jgi:hypothetical protein